MSLIKLAAPAKTNLAQESPGDFGALWPKMCQLEGIEVNTIKFRKKDRAVGKKSQQVLLKEIMKLKAQCYIPVNVLRSCQMIKQPFILSESLKEVCWIVFKNLIQNHINVIFLLFPAMTRKMIDLPPLTQYLI